MATEKLDGTNFRVTVRAGRLVRLEKRRKPTKVQKRQGILDGWYVDADEHASGDRWIFEAVRGTDLVVRVSRAPATMGPIGPAI